MSSSPKGLFYRQQDEDTLAWEAQPQFPLEILQIQMAIIGVRTQMEVVKVLLCCLNLIFLMLLTDHVNMEILSVA